MEYLASIIPEEHAAARQILNMRRPFGRSAEIVLRSAHRHILRSERDVEVVIEIVVEGVDLATGPFVLVVPQIWVTANFKKTALTRMAHVH